MATQPTPEQMAQNRLKGVKSAYVFVAVRHVHPWYSWALMAAAIGFAVGVGYVANRNVQFDESNAMTEMRRAGSDSSQAIIKIINPQGGAFVERNPLVVIRYNEESVAPQSALEFSYAESNPSGDVVSTFVPTTSYQHKSKYSPGVAAYALDQFEFLPAGFYVIRASLVPALPNSYSDVLVRKPSPVTKSQGACACEKITVEDQGAEGMQHRFTVIATGQHMDTCVEYQKINSTITFTDANGTSNAYVTDQGLNSWMFKQKIDEVNNDESTAKVIKAFPYLPADQTTERNTTDDDYRSAIKDTKEKSEEKVQWWDAPGLMPTTALKNALASLKKPWTVTYEASLVHVVGSCKCVTGVHITVKDGVVTENKLDPICQ